MRTSTRHKSHIVRSLRLVAKLLLGFVTLVLLMGGTMGLMGGEPGRFGKTGDVIALLAGASILFATANGWKTWIAGFFGLPAIFSGIGILISGHMPTWPYKPVPLPERVLGLTFAILLTLLTFPSTSFRKPSGSPGRACLTAAVITFLWRSYERLQVTFGSHVPSHCLQV